MPNEPPPLWTRSLAWSAAFAGVANAELLECIDPALHASVSALWSSIPNKDARARARALADARRSWLRTMDAPIDDEVATRLGARVIASIVASTPPAARASLARSFEANSLRAAGVEARNARACDSVTLQHAADALARITHAPPTALALGSLVLAALVDDTQSPRVAQEALRSLRCRAIDVRAALRPFERDIDALLERSR